MTISQELPLDGSAFDSAYEEYVSSTAQENSVAPILGVGNDISFNYFTGRAEVAEAGAILPWPRTELMRSAGELAVGGQQ